MMRLDWPHRLLLLLAVFISPAALSQQPFLPQAQWTALRDAASGSAPYENLRVLTGLHRVPGTEAFDQAADFMLSRAVEYGLQDAQVERFAIDGSTRYGLMQSYWAWNVRQGQLWQTSPQQTLLADASTDPIRLADYSRSADVDTFLVDVGDGSQESDYAGKDVNGKIVLADGVLSDVQSLAVMKFGAAGIVSDMPNQSTAWSGLDTSLVRWGHLDARQPRGFAFMVSRATAASLRQQMSSGATIQLRAQVQAEVVPGHWTVVTATIPGTDARAGEIVFSCHLDHERPGANDNGSGCVTILESARVLAQLIGAGKLPRPVRTLRFIWSPEIEGTMAYLAAHPDLRRAIRANVHMDMVGGDPFKNKSILHVTETPWSLPSFITDVGAAFAETLRDASIVYADGGSHADEAVVEDRGGAPGTRNAFFVDRTAYEEDSDHDVYDSSTVAVPSLYLRDWPDLYIHTDHDSLDKIDATKLRRVAVLGAASGYTYASLQLAQVPALLPFFAARAQQRLARDFERAQGWLLQGGEIPDAPFEAHNLIAHSLQREIVALRGFAVFSAGRPGDADAAAAALRSQAATLDGWITQRAATLAPAAPRDRPSKQVQAAAGKVPHRIGDFGPLHYQNDDVLLARLGAARIAKIQLLSGGTSRLLHAQGRGDLYAYEILNFVDGRRTSRQIRDAVSAEFGPIPQEAVDDYLQACEEARIIALR